VPVEGLELGLRGARGERLRLEIEDGDSPPLGEVRVTGHRAAAGADLFGARRGAAARLCLVALRRRTRLSARYDLSGLMPETAARARAPWLARG